MYSVFRAGGPATASLLLILAALLWSGNFIAGRALGDDNSALGLNIWRWTIALLILIPLGASETRRCLGQILQSWRYLALLGLTGVAGFHVFVYKALEYTAASNALLILSVAPALILIVSSLWLREPVHPFQWLGVLVSLVGALVLISRGELSVLLEFALGKGEWWMLAAVGMWVAYSVLLKKKPPALPQRATLTASCVFGLLWMAPLSWFDPGAIVMDWDAATLAGILYMAVGASVLAFLSWNQGVALVGPARAGAYLHLMPLFGTGLAVLLLDESLHAYHGTGGLLVFGGIAVAQLCRPPRGVAGNVLPQPTEKPSASVR